MNDDKTLTEAFFLKDSWKVIWKGQVPPIEFNSKGAALAYIDTCNKVGKLRA